jgi:hypothetical protein
VLDLGSEQLVGEGQFADLGPQARDLQGAVVGLVAGAQGGLAGGQEVVPPAGRR